MTKKDSDTETVRLTRSRISLNIGALVRHAGKVYRIVELIDFNTAVGRNVETDGNSLLPINELELVEPEEVGGQTVDIADIGDDDWQEAQRRFAIIKPFIDRPRGRKDVEARAKEAGVSPDSIYRWLRRYEANHDLSALISKRRGPKPGGFRLNADVEEIILNVIENHYLTSQKPTIQSAVTKIRHLCEMRGLKPPCYNAIRSRIAVIPERERLRRRGEREKAINRFNPVTGRFPGADYPLAVVQIDHTPVDIVLVDDRMRQPIGRPWLTLAIDVFSRMVAGYYLSLESPSVTSVGLCMAHAMLPKDEWLIMHGIDAEWPVWGVPAKVHVDNGPDFQADDFKRSCAMYGIDVDFRPVKTPRYGGHIERLLGTLMRATHELPGTTFSSVPDKGEYNPDRHSALTMAEFEEWLVNYICKVYHERLHRGIGMAPIQRWKQGLFGHGGKTGVGIPARPADRRTVLLDFMPSFRRTIQRTGVEIEGLKYYAEALRPWINYVDPDTGIKKKFLFRRDPRDVTVIWFRDPSTKEYVKVPVADQSLPPMSLWEYRDIRERLKQQGISRASSLELAHAHRELDEMVEQAKAKTRKARRKAQRKKEHARKKSPAPEPSVVQKPEHQTDTTRNKGSSLFGDVDFDAIEPYEEIE